MALPRPASASFTNMTEYVLPVHANALGNVFGGQVMAWIDLCAAICAQRHCGTIAVTAGIDDLEFEQPIKVGQVVQLSARITAAFRTSVEVLVRVEGENAASGRTWPCVTAYATFVAVDNDMHPTTVPPLELLTPEDERLSSEAGERRRHRLERRKRQRAAMEAK